MRQKGRGEHLLRTLVVLLALTATKYRSLRPAFVMHATFNAVAGFAGVFDA